LCATQRRSTGDQAEAGRPGLGVLLADAALQVFDAGMSLATHKGAVAVLPAALGAIDVWAALVLVRASRA
jgi:hypothetical protein